MGIAADIINLPVPREASAEYQLGHRDARNAAAELSLLSTADKQVTMAEKEAAHWRLVAFYLADIHAANSEGMPKRVGKSERARQRSILERTKRILEGLENPPTYAIREGQDKRIIERCAAGVARLSETAND